MPIGVAEICLTLNSVPTVVHPGGRRDSTAARAAPSIMAIIAGVAKTGRPPEPQTEAVYLSVTLMAISALRPVFKISSKIIIKCITKNNFNQAFSILIVAIRNASCKNLTERMDASH
jgi:hypothetical protein